MKALACLLRREATRLRVAPLFAAGLIVLIALHSLNLWLVLKEDPFERDPELVASLSRLSALTDPAELRTVLEELDAEAARCDAVIAESFATTGGPPPPDDPIFASYGCTLALRQRLQHIFSYPDMLGQQIDEARWRVESSRDTANFSYRSLKRQLGVYSELADWLAEEGHPLAVDRESGFWRLDRLGRSDLLSIVALFLLVWLVFGQDRELDTLRLVRTTRYGGSPLFLARWLLVMLLTLLLQLFQQSSLLLAAASGGAFGRLDRAVQSIERFSYSGFRLTVGGFLLRYLLLKIAAAGLLVNLYILLTLHTRSAGLNYLLTSMLLLVSALCGRQILPTSALNALHFLNPISLFDSNRMLTRYQDVQIGAYALGQLPTSLTVITGGTLLAFGLSLLRWQRTTAAWEAVHIPVPRLPLPRRLPSLRRLELGRIFRRRAVLLLILLVLFGLWQTRPEGKSSYYGIERELYLDAVLRHQGPLTPEGWQAIQAERQDLDAAADELLQLQEEGDPANEGRIRALGQQLRYADIFLRFYDQVAANVPRMEAGKPVHVLDEEATGFWFSEPRADALRGLFAFALALLVAWPAPAEDGHLGMRPLVQTSRHGYRRLGRLRGRLAWVFACPIVLLVSLPQIVVCITRGDLPPPGALIQSAPQLNGLGVEIAFWQLALLLLVARLLTTMLQMRLMQTIAVGCPSPQLSLLLVSVPQALPLVVYAFGGAFWARWPLSGSFLLPSGLAGMGVGAVVAGLVLELLLLLFVEFLEARATAGGAGWWRRIVARRAGARRAGG